MAKMSEEVYNEKFAFLEKQWNKELNEAEGIYIEDLRGVTLSNNKTMVWIDCDNCEKSHQRSIGSITRYGSCKGLRSRTMYSGKRYVKDNEKLMKEWNYELNKERNHVLEELTMSERKEKFWWSCQKCNENWQATPFVRERSNCPYCAKILINQANSFYELSGVKDRIAKHSVEVSKTISKSNNITWIGVHCCNCNDVMLGTPNKLMSDLVCECGYKIISCEKSKNRTQREIEEEYEKSLFKNQFPHLSERLVDKSLDNEVVRFNQYYEFYCDCGNTIQKTVKAMNEMEVMNCKNCRVKGSYPERFVGAILELAEVKHKKEMIFDWLKSKRYDFYIPETKTIIEVHGLQHYEETNHFYMSLEETQKNDEFKMKTALENGIENYIVIDARLSDFKFMKNSVEESDLLLSISYPKVDWEKVGKKAMIPKNIQAVELWNSGIHAVKEISEILGITDDTVRNYLLKGVELGICDYSKQKSYASLAKRASSRTFRGYDSVTHELIGEFESTSEIYYWLCENEHINSTKDSFNKRFRRIVDTERKDGKGYLTLGNFYWKSSEKTLANIS